MSAPTRAVLVPPRPNLGPDPFPPPVVSTRTLTALGVIVPLIFLGLIGLRRRFKSRRRPPPPRVVASRTPVTEPSSARDWMIVWSDSVRDALVERFGPSWRAKTTEEIATDERLADALGSEQAAQLLMFLNEADRAKFAAESDSSWALEDQRADDWREWVGRFLEPPVPAGPITSTNGK